MAEPILDDWTVFLVNTAEFHIDGNDFLGSIAVRPVDMQQIQLKWINSVTIHTIPAIHAIDSTVSFILEVSVRFSIFLLTSVPS
jgi:hypothetical protein